MRGDVLSGGSPKRLQQSNGQWTLEVVRQVAVDSSVYRPHSQLLEGPELILRYLKRNPTHHRLAESALRLLKSQVEDGEATFEAVNGEWLPATSGKADFERTRKSKEIAARRSQYVQLLELRAEHIRLQHAHTALLKKVMQLAQAVAENTEEIDRLKKQGPVVIQAPVQEVAKPESLAPEEPEDMAPLSTDTPTMLLPEASDLVRCIEQLIGGDATAKESAGTFNITASSRHIFMSTLVDDEDHVVGAVAMDLKATVYLGGTLLMVPDGELIDQVKRQAPSEDSIAASSEVCNSLSGSVNNLPENIHVRTNFLEPLNFAEQSWVAKPRSRVVLEDSFGGHIALLAK